jgi:hypothetical protein
MTPSDRMNFMTPQFFRLKSTIGVFLPIVPTEDAASQLVPYMTGHPPAVHQPIQVEWNDEFGQRPICDYPKFGILPAFSERAVESLRSYLDPTGSCIPLIGLETPYFGFHITNVVDALDKSESVFKPLGLSKKYYWIEVPVLRHSAVRDQHLFRLPESLSDFFVSSEFRESVARHKLTGFRFEPVRVS